MVRVTSARPSGPRVEVPGEDDVFHLAAAEGLRALLPHHPGERVDDVGLAGAVRADDAGDALLEGEGRRLSERLEALERQALQIHLPPSFLASRSLSAPNLPDGAPFARRAPRSHHRHTIESGVVRAEHRRFGADTPDSIADLQARVSRRRGRPP